MLQRVIAALGGQAYLNVRDTQCDGRTAQFGTAGTLMGFTLYRDIWLLPDKNRIEYISKGEHTIVGFLMGAEDLYITHGGATMTVFNGNEGWSLDKSGVSNQPDDLIKDFNEQLKSEMNHVLRKRLNETRGNGRGVRRHRLDRLEGSGVDRVHRQRSPLHAPGHR